MEINLNETTVRAMANRLRTHLQASASIECSLSMSLESTAKMLGHKNWDTLIGILRKEETPAAEVARRLKDWATFGWREKPPVVGKPFVLMWEAFACSEWGDGPSWAKIEVTQEFVNELHRQQTQCLEQTLSSIHVDYQCEQWHNDDELRIRGEELVVDRASFWLRAYPKHADYAVETRMIDVKDFFDVIERGEQAGTEHMAWADGVLFKDGSSAKNFAQCLADDGYLDESFDEARIDEMP